jgi:hypothetical protein
MARIALTCECGWKFFIPGSTPGHEVTCPSCTRTVSITGRKPGMDVPLSAGEIAARIQRRAAMVRLLAGLAAALTVAAIFALRRGSLPAPDPAGTGISSDFPRVKPPVVNHPSDRPTPPTSARISELRRRVLENVWLANMGSILSECLRYRNLAREWSQAQSAVAAYESRIQADQIELAAAKQSVQLEPYFASGDRIVGFGQRDLTVLKRVDAAQALHTWMNAWKAGAALEQVQILRDERRMTLILQFPEDTKELLLLLRHPALQLLALPDRDPGAAGPPLEVDTPANPDAVSKDVEQIAIDVCSKSDVFSDIVLEMRRRTESLSTLTLPIWPDESVRGIALIGNPLTFQPSEMKAATLLEIGTWWSGLTHGERIRFANYFGLSCAHTRAQTQKK